MIVATFEKIEVGKPVSSRGCYTPSRTERQMGGDEDALRRQLASLEGQFDQLSALLVDDGDSQSPLLQLKVCTYLLIVDHMQRFAS